MHMHSALNYSMRYCKCNVCAFTKYKFRVFLAREKIIILILCCFLSSHGACFRALFSSLGYDNMLSAQCSHTPIRVYISTNDNFLSTGSAFVFCACTSILRSVAVNKQMPLYRLIKQWASYCVLIAVRPLTINVMHSINVSVLIIS